jgi:hypothetical protein
VISAGLAQFFRPLFDLTIPAEKMLGFPYTRLAMDRHVLKENSQATQEILVFRLHAQGLQARCTVKMAQARHWRRRKVH